MLCTEGFEGSQPTEARRDLRRLLACGHLFTRTDPMTRILGIGSLVIGAVQESHIHQLADVNDVGVRL
jgi:hypothetical protein